MFDLAVPLEIATATWRLSDLSGSELWIWLCHKLLIIACMRRSSGLRTETYRVSSGPPPLISFEYTGLREWGANNGEQIITSDCFVYFRF
jgi:hypothetical protein